MSAYPSSNPDREGDTILVESLELVKSYAVYRAVRKDTRGRPTDDLRWEQDYGSRHDTTTIEMSHSESFIEEVTP